jgi:metal-sulfur cluster biosynthetic enzyme
MVAALLRDVIDPEIGVNIVDLGLVYSIRISEGTALIQMSLTTPGCPLSAYMEDSVHRVLWGSPGIEDVDLQIIWEPAWAPDMMSDRAKRELGWTA